MCFGKDWLVFFGVGIVGGEGVVVGWIEGVREMVLWEVWGVEMGWLEWEFL